MKTVVLTSISHGHRCYRVWTTELDSRTHRVPKILDGTPYYLLGDEHRVRAHELILQTFPHLHSRKTVTYGSAAVYDTEDPDVLAFMAKAKELENAVSKHWEGYGQFQSVTPIPEK